MPQSMLLPPIALHPRYRPQANQLSPGPPSGQAGPISSWCHL